MAKARFEPTTYWLGKQKVNCTSLHGVEIKWILAEFGKKRITDHDFPPSFMWAENNNKIL